MKKFKNYLINNTSSFVCFLFTRKVHFFIYFNTKEINKSLLK